MLRVIVDGHPVDIGEGSTVLAAVQRAGASVPHLCHDQRLQPSGACRTCLVEIDGEPRPVASCCAIVHGGMAIRTCTPELETLRRTNLSLLAEEYPASAAAGEAAQCPHTPFEAVLEQHGIQPRGTVGDRRDGLFHDDSHPYIGTAMDRCILCYRCVRICDEVQGQFVWGAWGRGDKTYIAPRRGETLIEGGCVSCGACVDACPSGALFDKRSLEEAEHWTRTTCVYCGVGCQMDVGSRAGHVTRIKPADSPVNRGHLCSKGRYAFEFATAADRITTPMIRRNGEWQAVGWDEALDFTAARLAGIRERYGTDAIGVLGSARATNEENYLAQKFARVVLGTNNVDCCARVCHTPSAKALKTMLGTGAATNSFDDIEKASLFLLCGCNPTENHPIVGARIKQAVLRGAKLIVIDPRRIELADYSELHLAVRPGGNVPLLNAMAATIVEEGLTDAEFLRTRVSDYENFAGFIREYAPERVAEICGVPAATIRAAARLYAGTRPAMCFHGLGTTEHLQGTEGVMALINLALLTGNLGRAGSGINPLRGQNNVQGAAHMGCDPVTLPGGQSIADAVIRERVEAVWGHPIPASHGKDLMRMIDGARDGNLKALWAFGYDVYLSLANANETGPALKNLELVIVQDLFMNETAKSFGTVFLPAASYLERDGSFMNSDRRVQRIRKVVEPPGEARPDWWIIQELARRLGRKAGFTFEEPAAIWDEVRRIWPGGAGLSYRRLERESLQWPCPSEDHPGMPVLHGDRFANGKTAALQCISYVPTEERCNSDYPLLLVTGRTLYHFNAGTMTYRTPNRELQLDDYLDISLDDAAVLGLADGERVRIRSHYGEATLPIRINAAQKRGELFASFHRAERFVNRLTSPVRDRQVGSPEYKVTAVRLERID
jgi:formate dehydrogenase major subunit